MESATRGRVLCLVMNHRLMGIDLDALEAPSKSYNQRKPPKIYPKPKLVFDLDYRKYGLPIGMGAFKSPIAAIADAHNTSAIIYLFGGKIENRDHPELKANETQEETASVAIYELEVPCSAVAAEEADMPLLFPKMVGTLLAPKGRPIVLTMAEGKTYVMSTFKAISLFDGVTWTSDWTPLLERLDFNPLSSDSSSSSSSSPALPSSSCILSSDKDYIMLNENFIGPRFHFVIGSRMFLKMIDSEFRVFDPPYVCFDAAAEAGTGGWVTDVHVDRMEQSSWFIEGGRSISIHGFTSADVFVEKPIHLILYYVYTDHAIRCFVGVGLESGVLLCSQDITDKIFKAPIYSFNLKRIWCFFLDGDGSKAYAVVTGYEYR